MTSTWQRILKREHGNMKAASITYRSAGHMTGKEQATQVPNKRLKKNQHRLVLETKKKSQRHVEVDTEKAVEWYQRYTGPFKVGEIVYVYRRRQQSIPPWNKKPDLIYPTFYVVARMTSASLFLRPLRSTKLGSRYYIPTLSDYTDIMRDKRELKKADSNDLQVRRTIKSEGSVAPITRSTLLMIHGHPWSAREWDGKPVKSRYIQSASNEFISRIDHEINFWASHYKDL